MKATTEFFAAIQAGEDAKLQKLLADDPQLASARDPHGISAIMRALYSRHPELLQSLLAAHPELDVFDAAAVGRSERLSELLRRDPLQARSWSADGFTALHFACFFGQDATGLLLLEHGADPSAVARNPMKVMPLHSAASARNLVLARALLEHGAPVDARQAMGWIPIHAAAQNGDLAMAELLLRYKADPRLTNDEGVSAFELARKAGHTELVALLER
jgi:ankyrin repeat protein